MENYGCTMNKGEGEEIKQTLLSIGLDEVSKPDNADLIILNTCVVIDSTEKRMLHRLRQLSGFDKKTILTGCLPAALPERVNNLGGNLTILDFGDLDGIIKEAENILKPKELPLSQFVPHHKTTASIPIAQGCLGDCSYCITKLARGRLKSQAPEEIIRKVKKAVAGGAKEIRLTCQDTGVYGIDIGIRLPDLVNKVAAIKGDFMIRIGMMNPENVSKMISALIGCYRNDKVFKFVHIPVQSGSDAVLQQMRRRYTASDFVELVERLRAPVPGICISTDVIVAFPGESEKDFKETCNLLHSVEPDIVNVTRFSSRPKTPASKMKDKIQTDVAKERSRAMTDLRFEIAYRLNKAYIGTEHRALITKIGKNSTMIGRIENYKPVVVGSEVGLGEWVDVEITDAAPTHLFGRIITQMQ